MPETISTTGNTQIIAGTFSNRENADRAIEAFRDLGIPDENMQVVVQLSDKDIDRDFSRDLINRGASKSQAQFYGEAVRKGKTMVAIHNVINPAPIIEVFDDYKAEYNPEGSRNLRDDVLGMTTGAAVGAIAGGVAGGIVGGPVGAAAGVAAGAVLGGGAGAAAGKAAEHKK